MPPSAPQGGFFGKLPARGDFLRAGLPRSFVQPWDDWLQAAIAGSRDVLGEDWLAAWMEAPIWRFHLAEGVCGPDAVLGLWMPSVDRAGRHFPLTLAVVGPGTATTDWLDTAEAAGLAALADELAPEQLAAALLAADGLCGPGPLVPAPDGAGLWWTDGAPRVPPTAWRLHALPDPHAFAAMLQAEPAAMLQAEPAAVLQAQPAAQAADVVPCRDPIINQGA